MEPAPSGGMFSDDLFEDGGARAPPAKRPRVGIPATKLLEPIEEEVKISGRPRHLRAMLLHAGQPRNSEPVAEAVKNQADDLGIGFSSDAGLTLGVIFERCARGAAGGGGRGGGGVRTAMREGGRAS